MSFSATATQIDKRRHRHASGKTLVKCVDHLTVRRAPIDAELAPAPVPVRRQLAISGRAAPPARAASVEPRLKPECALAAGTAAIRAGDVIM
jgi:hypothetical protein